MNRLRFKFGENEVELEGTEQFIKDNLEKFYDRLGTGSGLKPMLKMKDLKESVKKFQEGPAPTPAEFYTSKHKTDGVSQILIFAKYLDMYKNESEFTRARLNAIAKEARLAKDIHTQYFTNAVKQGLLRSHGKGVYSLTLSAESVLAAM